MCTSWAGRYGRRAEIPFAKHVGAEATEGRLCPGRRRASAPACAPAIANGHTDFCSGAAPWGAAPGGAAAAPAADAADADAAAAAAAADDDDDHDDDFF